jgi:hypothetical protein
VVVELVDAAEVVEVEQQQPEVELVALGGGKVLPQLLLEHLRAQQVGAVVVGREVLQALELAARLDASQQHLHAYRELLVARPAVHEVDRSVALAAHGFEQARARTVVGHDREQAGAPVGTARAVDDLELRLTKPGERVEHHERRGRVGEHLQGAPQRCGNEHRVAELPEQARAGQRALAAVVADEHGGARAAGEVAREGAAAGGGVAAAAVGGRAGGGVGHGSVSRSALA